ncbi:MAG TPA: hypothetical protein VHR84_19080 [Terriglobales bacterium]|jgi:hypothetical protein|nr:hypothetical protein [Terriglobales bacterium]
MRTEWNIYRTRFLVRARQLSEPVSFTDALGREHNGQPGDYLVEYSDGMCRITPRLLFEDIYVAMSQPINATINDPSISLQDGTYRTPPRPVVPMDPQRQRGTYAV